MMHFNELVPELHCSDIEKSVAFYTETLGFTVAYARPEERFAYLEREGAQLMVIQPEPGGGIWRTGELIAPYGRGINLQIRATDARTLLAALEARGWPIFWPLEEVWYRRDETMLGNRQFLVQDPDGYLLRFYENLGSRPVMPDEPPRRTLSR